MCIAIILKCRFLLVPPSELLFQGDHAFAFYQIPGDADVLLKRLHSDGHCVIPLLQLPRALLDILSNCPQPSLFLASPLCLCLGCFSLLSLTRSPLIYLTGFAASGHPGRGPFSSPASHGSKFSTQTLSYFAGGIQTNSYQVLTRKPPSHS